MRFTEDHYAALVAKAPRERHSVKHEKSRMHGGPGPRATSRSTSMGKSHRSTQRVTVPMEKASRERVRQQSRRPLARASSPASRTVRTIHTPPPAMATPVVWVESGGHYVEQFRSAVSSREAGKVGGGTAYYHDDAQRSSLPRDARM